MNINNDVHECMTLCAEWRRAQESYSKVDLEKTKFSKDKGCKDTV